MGAALRILEYGNQSAADGYPEIGSKLSGGSTSDECLVTFTDANVTAPFDGVILAFRFEALGAGGPVVQQPGGCGVATAIATAGGPFASGNSSFAFTMSGAEPNVTTAIFALGARGDTFRCGRCEILLPVISLGIPVVNGKARLPVPVSCDPIFIGGFFEVQWWPIGTSQTPCVFLPTASLSDRLDVTVGL